MYTLKIGDDLIYSPSFDELALQNTIVSLELNRTGTLQFQIPPTHPRYEAVKKIQADIELYEDEVMLWKFRILDDEIDFHNFKKVICEGELSYLLDTIQRPYEFQGRPRDLFEQFLNVHNSQVEERKQFKLGIVDIIDSNDYVNRSAGNSSRTLEAINEKLIKTHGGYIRTRHETDGNYLDCIADYNSVNTQEIRFGENLLDITRFIKGENIKTAIIPLGAETDEDGINGVKKRISIASVNGGKDYVFDQAAVNLFGWIWDTVEMDDVTNPANLKSKAEAYLKECINFQMVLELTAFDLHLVDVNIKGIRLGDWIRVVSEPHGLDRLFLVSKIDIDVSNPEQSKIYLGGVTEVFTANAARAKREISEAVQKVANSSFKEINDKVESATNLITGVDGGYVHIKRAQDGTPQEILILDTPSPDTARHLLRLNRNGIGFSTTGINGPYRNAWTIDGNLVADFIGSGSMLCDRIRGGSLVLGAAPDKVDGSLSVVDSNDFQVLSANKNGVGIGGDYLAYYSDGRDMPLRVGGFNVVERNTPGYGWYYYWESDVSRKNGIATDGPWVVWGGWNLGNPDNPANYRFVVFDDGRCKAMSWITGSRAEDKKNIVEFTDSALDEVRKTKVYEYDLKSSDEHHIGFVIGEDYDISEKVLDGDGSGVEMYNSLALAYKAIQELEEKVTKLEQKGFRKWFGRVIKWLKRVKEGAKNG